LKKSHEYARIGYKTIEKSNFEVGEPMRKFQFVRVAAGSPELRVCDCDFNRVKIEEMIDKANEVQAEFLVLPELCITGYTCGDLFKQDLLLKKARESLLMIAQKTKGSKLVVILGMPLDVRGSLFNCACVLQDGRVLGIVPKTHIPGYNEFYEPRWFSEASLLEQTEIKIGPHTVSIGNDLLFVSENDPNIVFGIEICEDLWVPIPPSGYLAQAGALLIFNPSASNDLVGKADYRRNLVANQSGRCIAGYVYASCNTGESTTDLVFGGHCLIAENGRILQESERFIHDNTMIYYDIDVQKLLFSRLVMGTFNGGRDGGSFREIVFATPAFEREQIARSIEKQPFVPVSELQRNERCWEILSIQTSGLMKRMRHSGLKYPVIGISGGLDSTLAFIVAVRAANRLGLPSGNVQAVTMPGFGTTGRTYDNAVNLINNLGATLKVVDIKEACLQHFKDIGHDPAVLDVTYENVQARERTQILMDYANKIGGFVVGTGDLSELALGWATYNGDHMSMYGVNASVPKTLVRYIIQWYADNEAQESIKKILYDILDTPISPELLPPSETGEIMQKTEDILGPYEAHDFFLYHVLRSGAAPAKIFYLSKLAFKDQYSPEQLLKWLKTFCRRFFTQQFKRSCLPDGPKVGTVSLSPRGDWRMPSDASVALWMKELDEIQL
jgi:NAD+ synthase (glutamine-hydrolysing)